MLTKDCKKFLDTLNSRTPEHGVSHELEPPVIESRLNSNRYPQVIRHLIDEKYIEIIGEVDKERIVVLEKGQRYKEIERQEFKALVLKDVLIPIIVALITAFLTVKITG